MRSQAPDADDPLLEPLRGPDTDGSLAVSLGVALAVVMGVLATVAPATALAALALVAGGYLLASAPSHPREWTARRRRRLCVPRTTVRVEV